MAQKPAIDFFISNEHCYSRNNSYTLRVYFAQNDKLKIESPYMQTKLLCMMLSIYSGILMASDNHIPLYVTLPSEPSSAGHTITEKIDINRIHRGDTKTLKELIQESAEDNKPMFPIVAYWYRLGRQTGRAYGSYKSFKELRNVVTILAQSFYYITSLPQGYFIICSDEPTEELI